MIESNKVKNIFEIASENFKHSFNRKIYFFNQNKKFDNISWLVSVHRKNTFINFIKKSCLLLSKIS